MRFSVVYPLVTRPYEPEFLEKKNIIRFAQAAEAAGFDSIGFTDHPAPSQKWLDGGGHDALDPFAALAFCAAVTDRIRLMSNIIVLPYRNPFVLAKAVATVDVLSEGRFTFGTAAGYLRSEYAALGVDFEERNHLFDEGLEALKGIWSQDEFSFEGRHFMAKGLTADPKPAQQPHPPIWIGGNSKIARRRVARAAQGWMPFHASALMARTTKTPVLETNEQLAAFLDELWSYCDAEDRDRAEIDVHYQCAVGGSPASQRFDVGAHIAGIDALAKLGVSWVGVGTPSRSIGESIETLDRYGREVIAQARGIVPG